MKKRVKRSIIWKLPPEEFSALVARSNTYKEILSFFGCFAKSSYGTIRRRIQEEGIDSSHLGKESFYKMVVTNIANRLPLDDVLVVNSNYSRHSLKRRIIKAGILQEKCAICGMNNEWNGKKLVLVLDHINGIRDDNRRENLRLLCPNCNSQEPTFSGRNMKECAHKRTPHEKIYHENRYYDSCPACGERMTIGSSKCHRCAPIGVGRKAVRPPLDVLKKEIEESNYCAVGRKYGVSDNAIRKWVIVGDKVEQNLLKEKGEIQNEKG